MASGEDYVNYVLEQLAGAGRARARRMFGEYGLYLDDTFFAVVCGDELFVKPTPEAMAAFPQLPMSPPYEGAKDYIRVDDIDDAGTLFTLARLTRDVLARQPAPPRKRRRAK